MAQKQLNKQIEDIKSSLNKKYEDTDNPVQKIKSALSHLNITEIDIEKLKHAVTKTKQKNSKVIKKLQRQRSSYYHHHTHPQHRNVSIIRSTNNNNKNNNTNTTTTNNNNIGDIKCSEQTKWLYCIKLICRYLTYFFVLVAMVAIFIIIITKKKDNINNNNNNNNNRHNKRADDLTGMEQLRLLTQTVGQSMGSIFASIYNKVYGKERDKERDTNVVVDINYHDISIIQSIDSSRIFLKSSDDNKIHFTPFRKPCDEYSWCSKKPFSFQTDCVNVHNVRDVKFNSKTKELEFLISGSYPRLIEINRDSIVILNDHLFAISGDGKSLEELTNNKHYQNGNKFCQDNILFIKNNNINQGNKIIISGGCYGMLSLPFWNNDNNDSNELQLLSSQWSSIIIDSNLYVSSLIIASNNEASVIFRSKLIASNLNLAVTDNSYVEFKEISYADYISMITLKGSQIYIPSLISCKIIDFASRNHSLIEIANLIQINDIHLSISHFSIMKIPTITRTQLAYKRDKYTQLLLPHPYNYIQNNNNLQNNISFS